ncbi:restriction endonuclease subunit S [Streptococcus thermophilus]|uniref:restriction endonuclease subunit S n=1 Tax=Streptococcus thermophilus TaxID=1308 RepID=UPI002FE4DB62
MSKLEECILGDLVEFQRGYDLPKSKFVEGKYPVQSSNGILGYHNEYKVEGPGITIGRSGTVGTPHLIRENFFPHNTSLFVKEFKGNDIEYIYYLLQYLDLGNQKSGSGVPTMNRNHLHPIKIRAYRDKTYQQRTIKILSLIDKKIQINNQINQELEAMAKTLYDYWFVQFDFPDQNGKPYKSSGGKMVYHPELKREIPEGWGVEKLGELAQFKNGINYEKTSSGSEKVKIINVRNISSSRIFINQTDLDEIFLENDKSTNFIVNEGMILITRSGIPGATRLVSELEAKTVYSGFIIASEVNDLIYKNLIFYYLKNVEEVLKNQSAGTIMKNISQSVLTDMVVSLPPQNLLLKFNSIIDNLLEQMKNVQRQNQELTQLRDWLLPMLMNGQVKVE